MLTKTGCNSGACHGALAGKGGLKLSLRGYDPDADHFVLTRQALSRRVDRPEPAKSLMLLKPSAEVPHEGGMVLKPGSREYKILRDWIAQGAKNEELAKSRANKLEVVPAEINLDLPGITT